MRAPPSPQSTGLHVVNEETSSKLHERRSYESGRCSRKHKRESEVYISQNVYFFLIALKYQPLPVTLFEVLCVR